MSVDDFMMKEIRSIKDAISPSEILFVVDAMTGQDAVNTAKAFNKVLDYERSNEEFPWELYKKVKDRQI